MLNPLRREVLRIKLHQLHRTDSQCSTVRISERLPTEHNVHKEAPAVIAATWMSLSNVQRHVIFPLRSLSTQLIKHGCIVNAVPFAHNLLHTHWPLYSFISRLNWLKAVPARILVFTWQDNSELNNDVAKITR